VNPHLVCFLLGMAGNAAVEVMRALSYFHRRRFHAMYRDRRFWMTRALFAVFAGIMALAYSLGGFSSPLLAFHVGAAAPLILQYMTKTRPAEDESTPE
jgi:hypothetical protein